MNALSDMLACQPGSVGPSINGQNIMDNVFCLAHNHNRIWKENNVKHLYFLLNYMNPSPSNR